MILRKEKEKLKSATQKTNYLLLLDHLKLMEKLKDNQMLHNNNNSNINNNNNNNNNNNKTVQQQTQVTLKTI